MIAESIFFLVLGFNINQKGLVGKFYALAQLTDSDYNASLTSRKTKGVDILVMNEKCRYKKNRLKYLNNT